MRIKSTIFFFLYVEIQKKVQFHVKSYLTFYKFQNLTIKSRAWYFQLLHSQRWWVQGMWCFMTTLQLVCFQLSLHYHLNQLRHFWQKQQMTIFALNCCPTSSLRFFVFLKCFSSSLFSHSFTNVLTSSKWRRSCCLQESYSLQRLILIRETQEV